MKKSFLLLITCLFCMTSSLWAAEAYVVKSTDGQTLTFYYDDNKASREGTVYNLTQNWKSTSITTVIFDSSFAQARPTSTESWFCGMHNLQIIENIQYLNTSEVTNMGSMFYGCRGLTSLELRSFNTQNVTDTSYMFYECYSLTSLELRSFDTKSVTNMRHMFDRCSSLKNLDLSSFNTQNVTDMGYMFFECSSLTSLDLSSFNTQNVTDMNYMFRCSSLTSLDLSSFNTQNVTNMRHMFDRCSSLTSLDLSNFDTKNVTNMGSMFSRCSSLTSLDLSNFDTKNVTNMGSMFIYCSGLTSLDLSNFDTKNVTNMSYMFYECYSLTSLVLRSFDTKSVTNMSIMFDGCSSLKNLDLSSFNTQNVTDMSSMFSHCSGLTSLDLSNFDTKNVTDMGGMFYYCSGLTSLDLSNFDISKVTSTSSMLGNCSNLKSLSISPTMENIASNACSDVGTETNPCLINQPDGFDFDVDTSGDYFVWKGGYFTLGKQEYEGKMGDVNNDGVVSISDAICIISWLQENMPPVFIEGTADYNEDGSITVSDALAIIRTLLNEENEPATHIGEAIDLGLPSGLKWASFNVGATSPEEIGGYYAWGETEEKNGSYDESTYNYYHSSFDNLGANISGTNYDVAHIKWGGTWRMPTKDEFDELIKHCSLKYSTLNNVNGITFVGPNGNSIFLPTAGFRRFQGSLGIHNDEKWGYYWTSTQAYYQYEYCAYNLFINYQSYAELQLVRGFRTKGLLVRPVTE